MSKELEALEEIRDFRYGKDKLLVCQTEMYSTIKKGLERLEAIDNAKPSEALNGLEFICKILNEKRIDIKWLFKNEYNTIKQALLKAQEQEKVLEILFKKQVDLGWLWYCIHECVNSLNEYNKKMPIEKFKLTQEEFDLLKRYFDVSSE